MSTRTLEQTEPVKVKATKQAETGFEFTDLGSGGNAENIKRSWSVDDLMALGVQINPRVKQNVNGTLYLTASMNGQIESIFFSKKMQALVAVGQKLQKSDVKFYTLTKEDGEIYTLAGRPGEGFESWD